MSAADAAAAGAAAAAAPAVPVPVPAASAAGAAVDEGVHRMLAVLNNVPVAALAVDLGASVYVWVGDGAAGEAAPQAMGSLIAGFATRFEPMPLTAPIVRKTTEVDSVATDLAARLTKRVGVPCFVSASLSTELYGRAGLELDARLVELAKTARAAGER